MAITGVRGEQIRDGEIETVDIADGAITNAKIAAGTIQTDRLAFDHGGLPGLLDDDHTQYVRLGGRAGGQTLYGGTGVGDDLTLETTSNATKGTINIAIGGGNVVIGNASAAPKLLTVYKDVEIRSDVSTPLLQLYNEAASSSDGARDTEIIWRGEAVTAGAHDAAKILVEHDGAADDTKARFSIWNNNGSGLQERLRIDWDGVAHFYEGLVIEENNLAILDIYNTTASDADGARDAIVRFQGTKVGPTKIDQAQIRVEHDGAGADNKTRMVFLLNDGALNEKARLTGAGLLNVGTYIGSSNMTTGVVINQGSATNEALAIASDGVNHGVTAIADTDVYFAIRPESGAGGARLVGLSSSTTATTGFQIWGMGNTEDTTDTATSRAVIELQAQKKLGSSTTAIGSTGNMVIISNNGTAKWLIKGNGDTHRAGTDQGNASLDAWDDAALARTFDLELNAQSVIRSRWDEFVKYNREDLVAAGIISEDGSMYNESQLLCLHNGAIWQLAQRIFALEEKIREVTNV